MTDDTKNRVWIIHIPKHLPRRPVLAHKKAWQRIEDSLVELTYESAFKLRPAVAQVTWTRRDAHQDYTIQQRINFVENPGYLYYSNAGTFLPGTLENALRNEESQSYFRNECLRKALVDFNMIDTVSRGTKKMFNEQWRRHFPMPDYEIDAARKKVVVRIYGNEINKRYTDLLKTNNTLSLWDCISLDAVQKGRLINECVAKDLLCRGLIEGEAPNYNISLGVAKNTHQLPSYTKTKGLDKEKLRQMILQYLKNAGDEGAKRDSIYEYIKDVLPQSKSHEQQLRMLGDILNAMKEDSLIMAKGRTWHECQS